MNMNIGDGYGYIGMGRRIWADGYFWMDIGRWIYRDG